jgi:hypothetical protein
MRPVLTILTFLIGGCGSMGLDITDTGDTPLALLGVDPMGDIDFGRVSPAKPKSALQDVVLYAQGEGTLAIVDVYLSNVTSEAFTMRNNLPLPIRLDADGEFPVQVRFLPYAAGAYAGEMVVLVDDGSAEGEEIFLPLTGRGCDDPDETGYCGQ